MTIYKYPIEIADIQTVMMPLNASILTVQMQGYQACLWAQVEERIGDKKARTIEVFGTGHPMTDAVRVYIGTVQTAGGALVFHVFERTN